VGYERDRHGPTGIVVGEDAVWVLFHEGLLRLDPEGGF